MAHQAFGSGKVILVGEHAVVYGKSALAAPLSLGVRASAVPSKRCELELRERGTARERQLLRAAFENVARACGRPKVRVSIQGDLPTSLGLGSSAAVSVACARVLLDATGERPSPRRTYELAFEMERAFHGNPSGVDHATSAFGTLIHYRRQVGAQLGTIRRVVSPRPLKLLVAIAGKRASTRETVAALGERRALYPRRYERIFDEMGTLADEGARAVEKGDLESLGDAMSVAHGLLASLQLSSPEVDALVHKLLSLGALGAKVTGAGRGGAVIALFLEPEPVVAHLSKERVFCFSSQVAGPLTL